MTLLAVEELYRQFGGGAAVDGVSFDVKAGEVLGLIGPNGSGKTTVLNMLSGFLAPHAGRVRLREQDITGWQPDRLARQGVLRMFQMTRVFTRTSAFDNLLTAGLARGCRRVRPRAAHSRCWRNSRWPPCNTSMPDNSPAGSASFLNSACASSSRLWLRCWTSPSRRCIR